MSIPPSFPNPAGTSSYNADAPTGSGGTPLGINPFSYSNGDLNINAILTPSSARAAGITLPWLSGMISTEATFTQQYGYFEMRAELPTGQGIWPQFWLFGSNADVSEEIDVMEALGNNTTQIYQSYHSPQSVKVNPVAVSNYSARFHTYGVEWSPTELTYFVDGKQTVQLANPFTVTSPVYMIANLAVGGSWGGNADSSTPSPSTMKIDYIRAYQNSTWVPSSAPAAAPPASYSGDGTSFVAMQPSSVTAQVSSYGDVSYTTTTLNAAWNVIKTVQVVPTAWGSSFNSNLAYDNFVEAEINLQAAGTKNLDVMAIGAKRGTITLDNGNDAFTWVAGSNGGSAVSNTMVINAGDGDDTIAITAAGLSTFSDRNSTGDGSLWNSNYQGNSSIAEIHLGAGTDTVTVSGAAKSFIYGSSGSAVVTCGGGADTIMVGTGGGDFTGGGGADLFVISKSSGHATIKDFSPGLSKLDFKGITIATISAVSETEQGVAGLSVTYNGSGHSVFLANMNAISASDMIFN